MRILAQALVILTLLLSACSTYAEDLQFNVVKSSHDMLHDYEKDAGEFNGKELTKVVNFSVVNIVSKDGEIEAVRNIITKAKICNANQTYEKIIDETGAFMFSNATQANLGVDGKMLGFVAIFQDFNFGTLTIPGKDMTLKSYLFSWK